jgi:hypothetical protein
MHQFAMHRFPLAGLAAECAHLTGDEAGEIAEMHMQTDVTVMFLTAPEL